MGLCASSPEDSRESQAIDKELEADGKRFKKECKILLLGSGDSGKSTIVKQMKIIHQGGFSREELDAWKPRVWRNVIENARTLAAFVREQDHYGDEGLITTVDEILSLDVQDSLNEAVVQIIQNLSHNPVVQTFLDGWSSDFYLMDSATYFFDEITRIGSPSYHPTETDVLRARATTTAITETRFTIGQLEIHMFDVGGQRSERRKWIHMFESVTSIIFCVAISEYDLSLPALEDPSRTNRLAESLTLFESVVNSRWFLRTSIVLFLNKTDVFKKKVKRVPLGDIKEFRDYGGGKDVNKAAKYILWRFMKKNRASLRVYPHLTQATDTENVRFVFSAVKETILQNALQDSGML